MSWFLPYPLPNPNEEAGWQLLLAVGRLASLVAPLLDLIGENMGGRGPPALLGCWDEGRVISPPSTRASAVSVWRCVFGGGEAWVISKPLGDTVGLPVVAQPLPG